MAPDSELLYLDRHKDQEQVRRKREGVNVRPSSEFQALLADEARRRGSSGFGIMTKGHKPRGSSRNAIIQLKKGRNTGGRKTKKKRRTKRKKRKRKKKTRRKKRKRTRRRKRS